jgi:DNA replication and repair protein RecF
LKIEWGQPPVILLDDVLSELDPQKRQELLSLISQEGQQTIVTDTEARSYQHLSPIIYQVEGGTFSPWDQKHDNS